MTEYVLYNVNFSKENYSKELYLNLRITLIELENGNIETPLINLTPEIMTTEEIYQIYYYREELKPTTTL